MSAWQKFKKDYSNYWPFTQSHFGPTSVHSWLRGRGAVHDYLPLFSRPLCFLFGLTAASERADSPPGCFRSFALSLLQTHIPQGERERARPVRSGTNDQRKRQMALMAGILFTATSVLLGISTCVSSARIYPPNEGKTGNNSGAPFWTFSPLVYTPSTSCVPGVP